MSNPQHEPTMEEILASIRKIISEDAPEAAAPAAAAPEPAPVTPAPAPPPPPEPVHDDVLELTQEIEVAAPEPAPAEDIVFENVAPAAPAAAPHSDIFSDQTRKAMEDTFNAIPEEEPEPVAPMRSPAHLAPVDGATVENVFERAVRESFEPVDLFHAHIAGMDTFARGLKIAAAMRADGQLEKLLKDRYASWDSGLGAEIEAGTFDKVVLPEGAEDE